MMPLFKVQMPANAAIFFRNVMEIAAFDFYEFDDFILENFALEPLDPIDANFEAVGFQSQYVLINMGSMLIFYLLYLIFFIVVPQLTICESKCGLCCQKLIRYLQRATFWGPLITLTFESFVIIAICILLNMRILSYETTGQAAMSVITLVLLTV